MNTIQRIILIRTVDFVLKREAQECYIFVGGGILI